MSNFSSRAINSKSISLSEVDSRANGTYYAETFPWINTICKLNFVCWVCEHFKNISKRWKNSWAHDARVFFQVFGCIDISFHRKFYFPFFHVEKVHTDRGYLFFLLNARRWRIIKNKNNMRRDRKIILMFRDIFFTLSGWLFIYLLF